MPSNNAELLPCRWCLGPARLTEIKGSPTNPLLVSCETSSNGSCPMTLAMTPEEWNTRATKCNHPGAHTSWCNYGKSAPASPLIVPACPHLHVDVMSFCMDCGRYRNPPTAQGDSVPAGDPNYCSSTNPAGIMEMHDREIEQRGIKAERERIRGAVTAIPIAWKESQFEGICTDDVLKAIDGGD